MTDLSRRLAKLERLRQARARSTWTPPIVEARDWPDPVALALELERIETEAIAAGWRPESGRPFAITVYLDLTDPIEPTELEGD